MGLVCCYVIVDLLYVVYMILVIVFFNVCECKVIVVYFVDNFLVGGYGIIS